MALSNWDTLAIGTEGKSVAGGAKFGTLSVEIYKNWLYLRKDDMVDDTEEESSCNRNVLGSINQGDMYLFGVNIKAVRGPQNAIFVYANMYGKRHYEKQEDGTMKEISKDPNLYFCGIGCYGYGDLKEEYIKSKGIVLPRPYDELMWYSGTRPIDGTDEREEYIGYFDDSKPVGEREVNIPIEPGLDLHPWVGVTKETLAEFRKWLENPETEADEEYLKSIDWDNLLRFNQGDAYFANVFQHEVPATELGGAETPMIMDMIGAMKVGDEEKPNEDEKSDQGE